MALRDLVGQERAVRVLTGTLMRDRVPSALLLSGDAGIGKKQAALDYAKALNCLNLTEGDCCDRCSSCTKIAGDRHPDVLVVSPDGDEVKIDAIRGVIEWFSLKPFEGQRKVVIIEGADRMNQNAANAFLKTLEEPPAGSHILLLSSSPDRLPETIRSRCAPVRFYPLSASATRGVLERRIGGASLDQVLPLVMGRPGVALSKDVVKEKEWFFQLLSLMLEGDAKEAWADRAEMKSWLDLSFVFLRDLAVADITGAKTNCIVAEKPLCKGLGAVVEAYRRLETMMPLLDNNLSKAITWNYVATVMRQAVP